MSNQRRSEVNGESRLQKPNWGAFSQRLAAVAVASPVLAGCSEDGVTAAALEVPNRTVMSFAVGADRVHECLASFKGVLTIRNSAFGRSVHIQTRETHPESFASREDADDALINPHGEQLGLSEIYSKRSCPLPYVGQFRVHVVSEGADRARVEIHTLRSYVLTGKSWSPHTFSRVNQAADVPPTTIDEYRILVAVGECLGYKDLPPVRLPQGSREVPMRCVGK
jgi:hypothetical protein